MMTVYPQSTDCDSNMTVDPSVNSMQKLHLQCHCDCSNVNLHSSKTNSCSCVKFMKCYFLQFTTIPSTVMRGLNSSIFRVSPLLCSGSQHPSLSLRGGLLQNMMLVRPQSSDCDTNRR